MHKLDPSTYRTMPWANGGGTTTEAFTLPAGASLAEFQVRVSMARVEADGPFSRFQGVDRTLVVTDGAGLALEMSDGYRVVLDSKSAPFSFTGDDAVRATLVGGPVSDFNVMTRRSALRHRVGRVTLEADEVRTVACSEQLALILVLDGEVTVKGEGADGVTLTRGGIVTFAPADGQLRVEAIAIATVLLVDFFER